MIVAIAVGTLTAAGVCLILRSRVFPVILGLAMLSHAVNVFLFASGRLVIGAPPITLPGAATPSDPLAQALVLTAIVISFGMTAVMVILALGARLETGDDRLDAGDTDGEEDEAPGALADPGSVRA